MHDLPRVTPPTIAWLGRSMGVAAGRKLTLTATLTDSVSTVLPTTLVDAVPGPEPTTLAILAPGPQPL